MSETVQIIIGIGFLLCLIVLSRRFMAWRIRRAFFMIVEDLNEKGAFDAQSAVDLPYARSHLFRVGLRDYRPMAMKQLIQQNIVGVTPEGTYFLINRDILNQIQTKPG